MSDPIPRLSTDAGAAAVFEVRLSSADHLASGRLLSTGRAERGPGHRPPAPPAQYQRLAAAGSLSGGLPFLTEVTEGRDVAPGGLSGGLPLLTEVTEGRASAEVSLLSVGGVMRAFLFVRS